jgi:hypothetical protein
VIAVTEKGDIAYSAILKGMPAIVMSVAHRETVRKNKDQCQRLSKEHALCH